VNLIKDYISLGEAKVKVGFVAKIKKILFEL
jgi:hypothetical protein